MFTVRHRLLNGTLVALLLLAAPPASAQQPPAGQGIGVVTAIQGQATVARQALPEPAALRFRDDVFFRDQVATKERSTVRLLLGGKGVLTVREQSQVTLDESVTPEGQRRSVVGLLFGKIGASIAHALMRPGDVVEIQTPNAVAAVRGTVLIAEYIPPESKAEDQKPVLLASAAPGALLAQAPVPGGTSHFFVLAGQVTITPFAQPPVTLGPLQTVSIISTPVGVQPGAVQNITPGQAAQAAQGLQTGKPHTGEAEASRTAQAQAQVAAAVATAVVQAVTAPAAAPTPEAAPAQPADQAVQDTAAAISQPAAPAPSPTAPPAPTTTVAPIVPQVVTENILPSGPVVSLDNVMLGLAAGTSLATFSAGTPSTITRQVGAGDLTAPLLEATGIIITHTGAIVTLTNGGAIVGASTDTTTPLVKIDGTALTNSGGALLSLSGGSALATFGPLASLQNGASATLAGLMAIGGTSGAALGADGLVIPSGTSLTATDALFRVEGGSKLHALGGSLVSLDPSTLTLSAPILSATDSSVGLAGSLLHVVDSTVTATTAVPGLAALQNSDLALIGGPLLDSQGSTLSFAGPLVAMQSVGGASSSLSSSRVGTPLFSLAGGSLTLTGSGALLTLNGGSVDVAGSLFAASGGATITTTGVTGPLVSLSSATLNLTDGGSLISVNTGANITGSGIVLDSVNSHITTDGPIFALRGGSKITYTGSPLIRLSGSSLTAQGGFGDSDGAGNQANVTGTWLEATNSSITLGSARIPLAGAADTDVTTISAPAGVPQIRLTSSSLTDTSTGSLFEFSNGTSTYAGLLLVASDSSITLGGKLLELCCGERPTASSTAPLIQLTRSSVSAGANLLRISRGPTTASPSSLTLAGPLVSATDSSFDVTNHFLRIAGGGSLTSTSSDALVTLSGTSFTGGAGPGSDTGGSFLNMRTDAWDTAASSLTLAGPLLKATNATFHSTDGSFIVIRDNAIVTSTTTSPLVEVSGSTVTADSNIVRVGPYATNDAGTTVIGNGVPPRVTLAGPGLKATDTHFTANNGSFLSIRDTVNGSLTGTTPFLQLVGTTSGGTTVTATKGNFLTLASAKGELPGLGLASSLLDATNTTFTIGDPSLNRNSFLFVGDGGVLGSTSTDPLVRLSGSSLTTAGDFLTVRRSPSPATPSSVMLSGPLASLTNSSFTSTTTIPPLPCCDFLFVGESAGVVGTGSSPLLQFSNSTIKTDGTFISLNIGGTYGDPAGPAAMALAGPLSSDSGSTFNIGGSYLSVRNGSALGYIPILPELLSMSPENWRSSILTYISSQPAASALLQFSGSTVNMNGNLFNMGSGPGQPGSVTGLVGPLLSATNSAFDSGPLSSFLSVYDGATFASATTDPLLTVSGGSITTKGHVVRIGLNNAWSGSGATATLMATGSQDPVSMTLAGPLLKGTDTTITAMYDVLGIRDRAAFKSTTTAPLIQLGGTTGSTLTLGGLDPDPTSPSYGHQVDSQVFAVQPVLSTTPFAASAELFGPVLSATNTTISTTDRILGIFSKTGASATLTSHTADPLVQLTGGSVTMSGTFYPPTTTSSGTYTYTSGRFLAMSSPDPTAPATLTLAGPLLSATSTTFEGHNHFLRIDQNANLTSTGTSPLLQLSGTTFSISGTETFTPTSGSPTTSTYGDFTRVQGTGASLNLAGPLVSDTGSTFNLAGQLLVVRDSSTFTGTGSLPLLQLVGSHVTAAGNMICLWTSAPTLTLAGPLLSATNSTLKNGDPAANAYTFFWVGDSAQFTSTSGSPLLNFDASSVDSAGGIFTLRRSNSVSAPTKVTLSGPLFSAVNGSTFNTTSLGYPGGTSTCCTAFYVGQGAQLSSSTTAPLIQLTSSTLNAGPDAQSGGNVFTVTNGGVYPGETNTLTAPSSVTLAGPLLSASDSNVSSLYNLLGVYNSSLTSTGTGALIQFSGTSGSTITSGGTRTDPHGSGQMALGWLTYVSGGSTTPATLSLQGPLLKSTSANITATGGLLVIYSGSQVTSPTTDPFISLSGGTHTLGSSGFTYAPVLDIHGMNTDASTGLGTDKPLQTGGTILQASGATVNLGGSGNAIKVDTALLAASAPIVSLINSTINTSSTGDPVTGAMHLYQSNVTSNGPVFGLDNSTLTVHSGPALSLTGGTSMTVTGDFGSLLNGSKITVQNGPLILVDGVNGKGTASTLNVSGALVNFGGTAGNQVIIYNSISPTATLSGVPVSQTGTGSSISIGPNPIKNPTLGTVSVTGSAIQATNGGKVTITAR